MEACVLFLCREITRDIECITRELEQRNMLVQVLRPAEIQIRTENDKIFLEHNNTLLEPHLVVGWTSGKESQYGNLLLQIFSLLGYRVLNDGKTLETMQSKPMTSILLAKYNLPHVLSLICGRDTPMDYVIAHLGLPLVTKPVVGSKGNGVLLLNSEQELLKVFQQAAQSSDPLYFQQFIDKPQRDIRIQCANFEPIFGFFRYAQEGQFISNASQGGKVVVSNNIPDEAFHLARKASKLLGVPMAGIDLVEAPEGLKILEVNSVPGFQTVALFAKEFFNQLLPLCDKATMMFANLIEAEVQLSLKEKHYGIT